MTDERFNEIKAKVEDWPDEDARWMVQELITEIEQLNQYRLTLRITIQSLENIMVDPGFSQLAKPTRDGTEALLETLKIIQESQ